MITKIEIENFKSIEKAEVELGKFNVLIGPNNSGKSNFLEAIMVPKELIEKEINSLFSDRNTIDKYLWRDSKEINLALTTKQRGETEQAEEYNCYLLGLAQNFNSISIKEQISEDIKNKSIGVNRAYGDTGIPAGRNAFSGQNMKLESNRSLLFEYRVSKSRIPKIIEEFQSFQIYKFNPKKFHEPSPIKKLEMDADGNGFPSLLNHYLWKKKYESFNPIENKFKNEFPFIKSINFSPVGDTSIKTTFTDIHDKEFESVQISDGVMLILAFITICHSQPPPAMVAIEEPENGIHPKNLELVIKYLRKLSDELNTQVIITTHSPYLLDWVQPEEVLIFYREGDGPTKIKKMSDLPHVPDLLKGYMLGELWANFGEEKILKGPSNG